MSITTEMSFIRVNKIRLKGKTQLCELYEVYNELLYFNVKTGIIWIRKQYIESVNTYLCYEYDEAGNIIDTWEESAR